MQYRAQTQQAAKREDNLGLCYGDLTNTISSLEIHDTLRRKVREQQGRNPEPTACIIDSQTVKTTEAGGKRGFDGGKQLNGRKRHLTVDTEGNLLVVHVHPANIQDRDGAEPVLAETYDLCPTVSYGWADQGYAGELVESAATLPGITCDFQCNCRKSPRGASDFSFICVEISSKNEEKRVLLHAF
jgi:hypothetical protein